MKETLKRSVRTFVQAAAGYIAANLVMCASGIGADGKTLESAVLTLVAAAVAAGLAAVMNLPKQKKEAGDGSGNE